MLDGGCLATWRRGDESARSGLRVRGCRHSTTGRPAHLPSRRFLLSTAFLLFLFSHARALFPTLASSPPSPPLVPPEPLLPFLAGSPPLSFSARSDRRISRQLFHLTPSPLLFSPPWKKSRGSFLPFFPNYIENVDTIISERYVVYSSTSETGDLVIEGEKKEGKGICLTWKRIIIDWNGVC